MDIDKIILRALNRKASLEEYQILEEWKQESSHNLDYLDSIMQKANIEHLNYSQFDKKQAWKDVNSKISTSINYRYLLIGSLVAIVLFVLSYFIFFQEEQYPRSYASVDKIETIQLVDNSTVFLNKSSQLLQLSDFSNERKVQLSGEAFFEVEPDESKAFTIQLDTNDFIRVVGTSFNLINSESDFDLIVYSGVVELNALNRSIILNRGDRIKKLDGAYVKLKNNNLNAISWKTKELVFENVALDKVLITLKKHYGFDYSISDDLNLSDCRLRSKFNNESINDVLSELSKIFSLEYHFENNKLDITSLKCS